SISSRPALSSYGSTVSGSGMIGSRGQRRKRNHRVVNLRRTTQKDASDTASVSTGTEESTPPPSIVMSAPASVREEREDELVTPHRSPNHKVRFQNRQDHTEETPRRATPVAAGSPTPRPDKKAKAKSKDRIPTFDLEPPPSYQHQATSKSCQRPGLAPLSRSQYPYASSSSSAPSSASLPMLRSYSMDKLHYPSHHVATPPPLAQESSGGILEQAWMMKMATEIARKVREERERVEAAGSVGGSGRKQDGWEADREETPPPAYGL
ncbi:hypothetical protein LTS18_012346, partial [Coniosporium uncinatum]